MRSLAPQFWYHHPSPATSTVSQFAVFYIDEWMRRNPPTFPFMLEYIPRHLTTVRPPPHGGEVCLRTRFIVACCIKFVFHVFKRQFSFELQTANSEILSDFARNALITVTADLRILHHRRYSFSTLMITPTYSPKSSTRQQQCITSRVGLGSTDT